MKDLLVQVGFIILAVLIAIWIFFGDDSMKSKQKEVYEEQIQLYNYNDVKP